MSPGCSTAPLGKVQKRVLQDPGLVCLQMSIAMSRHRKVPPGVWMDALMDVWVYCCKTISGRSHVTSPFQPKHHRNYPGTNLVSRYIRFFSPFADHISQLSKYCRQFSGPQVLWVTALVAAERGHSALCPGAGLSHEDRAGIHLIHLLLWACEGLVQLSTHQGSHGHQEGPSPSPW